MRWLIGKDSCLRFAGFMFTGAAVVSGAGDGNTGMLEGLIIEKLNGWDIEKRYMICLRLEISVPCKLQISCTKVVMRANVHHDASCLWSPHELVRVVGPFLAIFLYFCNVALTECPSASMSMQYCAAGFVSQTSKTLPI